MGDAQHALQDDHAIVPVASAAEPASSSLLLQYLTLTGWSVDIQEAGAGLTALAERGDERVAAWAKTRSAIAALLFEQTCAQAPPPGRAALS